MSNVIDATDRFAGDPGRFRRRLPAELPANVLDAIPALSERPWTIEEVRALYCPAIKLLPFVVMEEGASAADKAVNYWCDEPTKHAHVDYKRGRVYAQLLLKAIEDDRPKHRPMFHAPRYLERIFEAMIDDAIERRRKGGKGSRTNVSSTVSGFLRGLSHHICGVKDPLGPAV
jgi:hypothetical protein